MQQDSFTVLVVCTGNLNRSALGAALLRTWAGWYLPEPLASQLHVTSAGLAAPVGNPMRRRTRLIAEALGAEASDHRAAQITEGAIRSADLVLVAEAVQRDKVLGFVPGALRNTFTIREAGAIAAGLPESPPPASVADLRARIAEISANRELANGAETDIVDPQGKGDEAYRAMAREEVPALARLSAVLFGMPPGEVVAYDEAVEEAAGRSFDGDPVESGDGTARRRGRRQA